MKAITLILTILLGATLGPRVGHADRVRLTPPSHAAAHYQTKVAYYTGCIAAPASCGYVAADGSVIQRKLNFAHLARGLARTYLLMRTNQVSLRSVFVGKSTDGRPSVVTIDLQKEEPLTLKTSYADGTSQVRTFRDSAPGQSGNVRRYVAADAEVDFVKGRGLMTYQDARHRNATR